MKMTNNEVWRPVKGYEGLYEVSNIGNVRSIKRKKVITNTLGSFERSYGGRLVKPFVAHNGYMRVSLCKDGKERKFPVHRLVAQAFIPNPSHLDQINHIDENKKNNNVNNLEWCDCKYNSNYGTRLERLSRKNGKRVFQIKDGAIINEYCSVNEAERQTGISHVIINRVVNGRGYSAGGYQWKYATSEE